MFLRTTKMPERESKDKKHGQQDKILQEGLPGGEFQCLAKAAAILDREKSCTDEGNHRKDEHRADGKDRHQADAHLEHQHQTHHQLGTTQPDREGQPTEEDGYRTDYSGGNMPVGRYHWLRGSRVAGCTVVVSGIIIAALDGARTILVAVSGHLGSNSRSDTGIGLLYPRMGYQEVWW